MSEFRSYFEQTIAEWLDKNKIKYEYEPRSFPYVSRIKNGRCSVCSAPAVQDRDYTPDFYFPDFGFYAECKGNFTSHDRKKMRDVKRSWPDIDIRMVLQSNNLIVAGDRNGARYSNWCVKYGFPFALRSIDSHWFKVQIRK